MLSRYNIFLIMFINVLLLDVLCELLKSNEWLCHTGILCWILLLSSALMNLRCRAERLELIMTGLRFGKLYQRRGAYSHETYERSIWSTCRHRMRELMHFHWVININVLYIEIWKCMQAWMSAVILLKDSLKQRSLLAVFYNNYSPKDENFTLMLFFFFLSELPLWWPWKGHECVCGECVCEIEEVSHSCQIFSECLLYPQH